jgi:catechol 2,3-dioxygenase-like lactoylglutathione lyase family enzyme
MPAQGSDVEGTTLTNRDHLARYPRRKLSSRDDDQNSARTHPPSLVDRVLTASSICGTSPDSTVLFGQQRSSAESIGRMRGRLHHVILDCPDPRRLAQFYSALLDHPITYASDDYVVVAASNTTSGLAFQLAHDHRAPTWPDRSVPQQMHLDIMVESVADSTPHVLGLGATKLDGEGVFADPAGHPFCLVKRPAWAEPISD